MLRSSGGAAGAAVACLLRAAVHQPQQACLHLRFASPQLSAIAWGRQPQSLPHHPLLLQLQHAVVSGFSSSRGAPSTAEQPITQTSPPAAADQLVQGQQQQQQPAQTQQQQPHHGHLTRLLPRPLFWNDAASNRPHHASRIPSRKPAIKAPARHQWHYCAPDYDPMAPVPQQQLPPYAPLLAASKDYRRIFLETRPQHRRKRYWRLFQKNLALSDQRWRQAWEASLAAERREAAAVKRLRKRLIRARAWEMWQLEQQQQDGGGGTAAQLSQ